MGGLTTAGCVLDPDEQQPKTSASPSATQFEGWRNPLKPESYYAVMALAAASAYPARFEGYTVQDGGSRVLRADRDLKILTSSTDPTKVTTYLDKSDPAVTRVVLAFRGTVHPTAEHPLSNWTDPLIDIWSQLFPKEYKNQLLDADPVGHVGGGWALRWKNVVKQPSIEFDKFLESAVAYSRISHVEINVVGHSLGGVVAELAGLDIEEYLHRNAEDYEVNVVAFNPPKLGTQALADEYRRRLKARPNQFRISVLTREGDVVDDVPLGYRQVIGNVGDDYLTPLCSQYMFNGEDDPDKAGDEGEARRLPYAPRLHVTKPFPYGSHDIDHWAGDRGLNIQYRQVFVGPDINPIGFRCMFAPKLIGSIEHRAAGIPADPQLNCTPYATSFWTRDCNPTPPPPGGKPKDEL
ncbi:MAG TPA: hypothetical protein VNO30_24950 [Kofleriaceae bacterium]|nr:hypothetical protein [Kofleriaceae bacterium]